MSKAPNQNNTNFKSDYKYADDDDGYDVNKLFQDIDDVAFTNSNKPPHRKKSRSSTSVLHQIKSSNSNSKNSKNKSKNHKNGYHKKHRRKRRHSESSSESHSSKDHTNNHNHRNNVLHLKRKKSNNSAKNHNRNHKHHILPLSNSKNTKNNNNNQKKSNSNPQSPRSRKSFTKSLLSSIKSVKSGSSTNDNHKNDNKKPLGISGPINVQHVIHVEWDDQRKAYKGIPDVWHSKIPQSYTVPTQELPVSFNPDCNRLHRSVSLTQSIINKTKSVHNILPQSHQVISANAKIGNAHINDDNLIDDQSSPILQSKCTDPLAMPLPGPRVFIRSKHNKQNDKHINDKDIQSQIPDFHGLLSNQIMTIRDYLNHIGIDNLNEKMCVNMIRRKFFISMGFSKRDPLINIPRNLQQKILKYLDIKSYLRCCVTCSDLASFLDDPIIWKIQVLYKSKVQGTLHKTSFPLRHRAWKAIYILMNKVDGDPSYYDFVWNIVVVGDRKSGQNRLVVSLGKHWRCKLTYLEPVISAVNGTYRFGVDFVIRRVIINDVIIKLQVWDGGRGVMADAKLLKSVNIFLILFDTTKKDSFDKTLNVARSMMSLLQNIGGSNNVNIQLIIVGNITNNPQNRIISYESAKRFANENGFMYIEANTDNPDSINNAFVNLAEECIHYINLNKTIQSHKPSNCLIQ